jgi:hypothetical protein
MPLATQYYLPAGSTPSQIVAAAQLAHDSYATLNTGDIKLQPAGVFVGSDWKPADFVLATGGTQ